MAFPALCLFRKSFYFDRVVNRYDIMLFLFCFFQKDVLLLYTPSHQ